MEHDRLIAMARSSMEQAYAPYSGFQVGASLLGNDGSVDTGCNIGDVSFGMTICAERVAVEKSVSKGVRNYIAVEIVTSNTEVVTSCGAYRQVLAGFSPDAVIVSEGGEDRREWKLSGLIPEPFGVGTRADRRKDEFGN